MTSKLTIDTFRAVMPKNSVNTVNQKVIDGINNTFSDPEQMEMYRDNLLGYAHLLREGRFKVTQYIDAIRYVGFKLMGLNSTQSYIRAFPDRYQSRINNGMSRKDINSNISAYNKTKLVTLIYEQTLVPTHILNADIHQEAINIQASIMRDLDVSPKVRSDAANSLLTHLKTPETAKLELDINVKESDVMKELREATLSLARQQQSMLQEKVINASDIAASKIIGNNDV